MLMRRRKILLATFLSIFALSIVYTIFAPRVYQATATLQVVTGGGAGNNELPVLADLMATGQARSVQTQVTLLKHKMMLTNAAKRLTPNEQKAVAAYAETLIEPVNDTNIISVSAMTRDPKLSVNLAQAMCAEYISLSQQKNRRGTSDAKRYVEDQFRAVKTNLEKAQTALKQYKQRNGVFNLSREAEALVDQGNRIEADWRQAKAEKAAAIAQLEVLDRMVAKMVPSRVVPTGIARRPAVEGMKLELMRLELDLIAKKREYTDNSPEVRGVKEQISSIRRELKNQAQTEVEGWKIETNAVRQGAVQDIARLQSRVWALEAQGHAYRNARDILRQQMGKMPEREHRLSQLTMDVAAFQQTYEMLNEKLQTLRITEKARVANAEAIFPADIADVELIRPRAVRILILGLMAGIILAICLALLVDQLDDRIHSEKEARQAFQLPVLADVPYITESHQRYLSDNPDNSSPLLATYQMLRTNIDFSAIDEPIRSMVVTSSLPGEGKSACAVNLAVAAALAGERVILVDCDLRRPTTHRLCRLPNRVGFTNVVTGSHSLAEALQETHIPGLRVLTAGTMPPNPFKLLKSKAAAALFQQLLQEADFVVIDTPPILALADAQIVSSLADTTLLVVSAKDTRRREIARTQTLLAQGGTDVVGIVLNKISSESGADYSYGYRYYAQLPASEETV